MSYINRVNLSVRAIIGLKTIDREIMFYVAHNASTSIVFHGFIGRLSTVDTVNRELQLYADFSYSSH